jgi:hypothetical protein
MEWQSTWKDPFAAYLSHFQDLVGDQRTGVTLTEIVKGIIASGSLVCRKIASRSPLLALVKNGAQRVIRFAKGQSTQRSTIDAEHLTECLRQRGVDYLTEEEPREIWAILDCSDLRKPYAEEMPDLMEVRDLDGDLVPGYRTVNVLGVVPQRRGLLYHHLFSSQEDGFTSQPLELQRAIQTVHQALQAQGKKSHVTWIMDSEMDDEAVWRTIWEQKDHLVSRLKHEDRWIEVQNEAGEWQEEQITQARARLQLRVQTTTKMKLQVGRQQQPKLQAVRVEVWACPLRVTYDRNVRRPGPADIAHQEVWLVEVRLPDTRLEPWLLLTDWPVTGPAQARRIFAMYRQRWAVEDSFKFTKGTLGWEEVQLLDLQGIRTLVALAWVAAGFLYELGITWEWPEIQFLARLGGWVPHKDRLPGKIIITRGLQRLLETMTTQAFLKQYLADHGKLPPRIAALTGIFSPEDL